MKQIFAFVLVLLTVVSLSACSADSEAQTQMTAAATPLVTQPNVEIGTHGERIIEGSNGKSLFENEFCSMTLVKAEIDSLSDYCWDVTLENRSDSAQIFTFKRTYVNDFDFDPLWAERVEPGETLETSIIWASPDMQNRGITQVTRVDFNLCIYAADAPETVYAKTDITVYPSVKSAHIMHSRAPVTTDIDVLDNADAKFVIVGFDDASRWGKALDIYAQNKTDERLVFSLEKVTVEGQPYDPKWSYTLDAGKQGISQITLFSSMLEQLEIEGGLEFEYELVICKENGTVVARIEHTFVP